MDLQARSLRRSAVPKLLICHGQTCILNRLEQRNGRIDRFGQEKQPIVRYRFLCGTFEQRILLRLIALNQRLVYLAVAELSVAVVKPAEGKRHNASDARCERIDYRPGRLNCRLRPATRLVTGTCTTFVKNTGTKLVTAIATMFVATGSLAT